MTFPEHGQQLNGVRADAVICQEEERATPVQRVVGLREVYEDVVQRVTTAECPLCFQLGFQACRACPTSREEAMEVIVERNMSHESLVDDGRDEFPHRFQEANAADLSCLGLGNEDQSVGSCPGGYSSGLEGMLDYPDHQSPRGGFGFLVGAPPFEVLYGHSTGARCSSVSQGSEGLSNFVWLWDRVRDLVVDTATDGFAWWRLLCVQGSEVLFDAAEVYRCGWDCPGVSAIPYLDQPPGLLRVVGVKVCLDLVACFL